MSALPSKMSALPPKADMCGATRHVCFGPKADISRCNCYVGFAPESRISSVSLADARGLRDWWRGLGAVGNWVRKEGLGAAANFIRGTADVCFTRTAGLIYETYVCPAPINKTHRSP